MSWWLKNRLMAEAGAGDEGAAGGGGDGGAAGSGAAGGDGQNGGGSGAGNSGAAGASGAGGMGSGSDDGTKAGAAAAGNEGAGDGKGTPPTWPDNWRETLAKGDDKRLSRLSRYASPDALADALIAAQNRISSGELRSALPKDATPEQVAAWRTENGIPESPDKYDLTFDNGLVIGENDKPIIDGFLAKAHEANYTPAQAKQAVAWYYEHMNEAQAKVAEETKRIEQQTEDALRAEWGNDYRGNINAINGLLDSFIPAGDEDLRTRILNGAKQNANFAKMLTGIALQFNPAGTIVGGGGADISKSIDDAISEIEKVMQTDRPRYNKDEKMQERYRQLLTARESRKKAA